ncbi:hypothetical protein DS909_09800 [Phaeobacter gallaeciensis]|uniref:Resolvase HTH domain-containing protein n=1 Tax=Phaeobacter gallaeciensis TaxID=60890 RepID=A0A366WYY8_9RHOB|nr:helix-turn-helix domain-containing protein [Phaeobacter gallaeciensis]RBW55916.1 hypothetical protein DS909_09800 [Phaeobacter gallaeciensis]
MISALLSEVSAVEVEGIAIAKAEGRYKGRKPTVRLKAQQIRELVSQGMTKNEVADCLGNSKRSVYRMPPN